ncbi:MAG: hypothetical protein ACT4OK_14395 [Gemmobacter sp.]
MPEPLKNEPIPIPESHLPPMIAKMLEDLLGTDLRADGFPARLT